MQLTLREAAKRAGISKGTVWKAVQRGELIADVRKGRTGREFVLDAQAFEHWRSERFQDVPEAHEALSPGEEQTFEALTERLKTLEGALEALTPPTRALTETLEAHEALSEGREQAFEALTDVNEAPVEDAVSGSGEQPLAVPMQAFTALLERFEHSQDELRRLDRENLAMRFALEQHRRALEANNEEIVEREARARQAEALLSERLATEEELRAVLDRKAAEAAREAAARVLAEEQLVRTKQELESVLKAREEAPPARKPWWKVW